MESQQGAGQRQNGLEFIHKSPSNRCIYKKTDHQANGGDEGDVFFLDN